MSYKSPILQKAFQREWMAAKRLRRIEELGGKCVGCGTTERLEIDHIDPALKVLNPAALIGAQAAWDSEKSNLQVLCRPCHHKKTWPRVHGTYRMYRVHKCRCDKCRAVNRDERRRWRARRATRTKEKS